MIPRLDYLRKRTSAASQLRAAKQHQAVAAKLLLLPLVVAKHLPATVAVPLLAIVVVELLVVAAVRLL